MPLLTAESITVGIGAAYAVGVFLLGIDPAYAWHNMLAYTDAPDMMSGLIKGLVFGLILALSVVTRGSTAGKVLKELVALPRKLSSSLLSRY